MKVEQRSHTVKKNRSTVPLGLVQASDAMGDARHKKSPQADDPEEPVTDAFRKLVIGQLAANKKANKAARRRRDDPEFLIENLNQLRGKLRTAAGAEIKTTSRMMSFLFGPVRKSSQPIERMVSESTLVRPILRALGLPLSSTMTVPESIAPLVGRLSKLRNLNPDDIAMVDGVLSAIEEAIRNRSR